MRFKNLRIKQDCTKWKLTYIWTKNSPHLREILWFGQKTVRFVWKFFIMRNCKNVSRANNSKFDDMALVFVYNKLGSRSKWHDMGDNGEVKCANDIPCMWQSYILSHHCQVFSHRAELSNCWCAETFAFSLKALPAV